MMESSKEIANDIETKRYDIDDDGNDCGIVKSIILSNTIMLDEENTTDKGEKKKCIC